MSLPYRGRDHARRAPDALPHQGVGTDGKMVATRVSPLKAGRAVTIGNEPVSNPDYYRAEIGIGVIFMNDVLENLFVPSIDTLGSGTVFGPAPGLTGDWQWVNIKDPVSNILGESGYFYGRFQIFPKPLMHAFDCTVFAYRRCTTAISTKCAVESRADVGTGAVALAKAAAAGDFDDNLNRVTVELASAAAGVGDAVAVKKADTNTFTGYILSDALAPKYVIGWVEGDQPAHRVHGLHDLGHRDGLEATDGPPETNSPEGLWN